MKRARYIAAAMMIVAVGCGFSVGDDEIAGEDGLPIPERARRARDDTSNDEPAPGPTTSTDPTTPAPDSGTTTSDAGTPPAPAGPLKAFVSSSIVTGAFGGVAGADKICNDLAKAQGLSGTYVAWISTTGLDAIDRLTAAGPWQRVDGALVAQTKAQLAQANLSNALVRDEKGATPPAEEDRVWTGTGSDGRFATGADCAGWTGAGSGRVGEAVHINGQWTSLTDEACTEVNRVYCFQNQ